MTVSKWTSFCVEWYGGRRDLHVLSHSFPTRRSSDLNLVFGIGAAELFIAGAIFGTVLLFLGNLSTPAAYGLGIALALSSTALVLPIAGTKSAVGRASFSMLLFEDLALVPIIFVLAALSPAASGDSAELILRSEEHTPELQSLLR